MGAGPGMYVRSGARVGLQYHAACKQKQWPDEEHVLRNISTAGAETGSLQAEENDDEEDSPQKDELPPGQPPLPAVPAGSDWRPVWDGNQDHYYYWNDTTETASWTLPGAAGADAAEGANGDGGE